MLHSEDLEAAFPALILLKAIWAGLQLEAVEAEAEADLEPALVSEMAEKEGKAMALALLAALLAVMVLMEQGMAAEAEALPVYPVQQEMAEMQQILMSHPH